MVEKTDIPYSRFVSQENRFKKVMVSAGVSRNQKTKIHFIDTNMKKVNAATSFDLLEKALLPNCRALHRD